MMNGCGANDVTGIDTLMFVFCVDAVIAAMLAAGTGMLMFCMLFVVTDPTGPGTDTGMETGGAPAPAPAAPDRLPTTELEPTTPPTPTKPTLPLEPTTTPVGSLLRERLIGYGGGSALGSRAANSNSQVETTRGDEDAAD